MICLSSARETTEPLGNKRPRATIIYLLINIEVTKNSFAILLDRTPTVLLISRGLITLSFRRAFLGDSGGSA